MGFPFIGVISVNKVLLLRKKQFALEINKLLSVLQATALDSYQLNKKEVASIIETTSVLNEYTYEIRDLEAIP
jgi:hypothetical protein